ncbi:tRNA (adenosine(37)-N6)-threonylcarbamoyltransferase complex ATPase subunit type 1 TsaE [Isobaculum melis]|uniref:tRNA threonylcarbamoyladenosine biosynthesis protein TsaE n=1 Tax=Isobaculum melis TaxID=142588 RepID=A0A1H9TG29_9LACT|nr:tRNA (adenosine(37)-N6)-threonylcarbamoyltransferase complex ATPase subunit type 1 TsaE [Isobaculum melis]SER96162.1 tRNA threonylcarbamoyladenosine biosynthesis protein TsaE [Isobaculum melis]
MEKTLLVKNEEETKQIALKLAALVEPGDVILLEGNLGAGKTTFSKGLALGLGIQKTIKSPTFTIIKEYHQGRLPFYHMDVYRLEDSGADDLGLEEYFEGDGFSVVEWAHLVAKNLPQTYLEITLNVETNDVEGRKIHFKAVGTHYEQLLTVLEKQL